MRVVFGQEDLQLRQAVLEHELIALGKHRQLMFVVAYEERALDQDQLQLLLLQDLSVLVAQDRKQDLVQELFLDRRPVDIEVHGIGRRAAVLEHIEPPVVLGALDAHVVRHDVQHLPHVVALQFRDQGRVILFAADLGIHRIWSTMSYPCRLPGLALK